ncbi:MAG: N-acetylmuramoyl-L-alanine amidase [Candidatus Omnitrophota bacterium]
MRRKAKLFLFFVLGIFIFGCARLPVKESLPVYNINGAGYYSLSSLCQLNGLTLNYDIYTRLVSLTKDSHSISFVVGDNLVLVDKKVFLLKNSIEIYEGKIMVPAQFKEEVVAPIFKVAKLPPSPKQTRVMPLIKKVVIDPGHGGHDPGAVSRGGLKEKDVNLDIAKNLAESFRREGIEVVMTRNSDVFIPLGKRVEIANNSKADLFISIHANANKSRSLHGFEVYYVSSTVSDSDRAAYAAKHFNLNLDSSCFASNSQVLKSILWDMLYTYNRAESIFLASDICRLAGESLNVRVIGVKDARFEVLRGARMPAVLVEVGFLSNAKEEQLLRDPSYRKKLSQSIFEGALNYACKAKEGFGR